MTLLLDTNVLIYATDASDHPAARHAREVIRTIAEGEISATTTAAVIQEFLHVRGRIDDRSIATEFGRDLIELLQPFAVVDDAAIERAVREFARRPDLDAFDIVLAAVVLERDDLGLLTADRALLAQRDLPVRSLEEFDPGE